MQTADPVHVENSARGVPILIQIIFHPRVTPESIGGGQEFSLKSLHSGDGGSMEIVAGVCGEVWGFCGGGERV